LRSNSICVTAKNPDRLGDVEDQSGDDADAKLPLEAKPDVEEHRNERERGCEQAVAKQLAAHPRTDDLDPPDLDLRQRLGYPGRDHPLRVLQLGLVVEADQNVPRRAELLHPEVAKAERRKCCADRVGRSACGPRNSTTIPPRKSTPRFSPG
jgi:hypothetical protein